MSMPIRTRGRLIACLTLTALLGASAFLASGCSDHPDSVANRFYTRLAALDIGGMAQLVCEHEQASFRESVAVLGSFPGEQPLELHDFEARTESSDGTAVVMRVSGRFVDEERGEIEIAARVRLVRESGAWCISGEEDGFRAVRGSAADVFALLVRGGISGRVGFTFPEDPPSAPVEAVTPRPGGPPEIGGEIVTTDSGLHYIEIRPGAGPLPQAGQTLVVHYTLWLKESGKRMDSSRDRGEPFEFALGSGLVVDGFDEGLATMRQGGERRLIVPPRWCTETMTITATYRRTRPWCSTWSWWKCDSLQAVRNRYPTLRTVSMKGVWRSSILARRRRMCTSTVRAPP
jgi:hypothetical protein